MKENWKGLNSQEVQYRRALFSGCEGAEVNHQFSLTLDAQLSMFGCFREPTIRIPVTAPITSAIVTCTPTNSHITY